MRILFLILLLAFPSFAGEPVTGEFKEVRLTDGTVLKDVTVVKVKPATLSLFHQNGIIRVPKDKLPADVLTKYAAAMEEAARQEKEKKEKLAADGLKVNVTVKEGVGFFRYCLYGHDQTGKGCAGTLSVTYATKDTTFGSEKKEAAFKAAPDGDGSASFDWVKGPGGPFSKLGITAVQWTLTTDDGRRFRAVVPVEGYINGRLPPEKDIKEVRLKDGTVFKDVCVTKMRGTTLYMTHRDGIAKIRKQELPAELLTKYAAAFEEAEKEAAEWAKERPPPEKRQALSAKYCKRGAEVKLTETQLKELNDLLEKCPEEPPSPPQRTHDLVQYGLHPWIECQTATSPFEIAIGKDSFEGRVVSDELKPEVEEFCRKLDQRWSDAHPPAPPKKKKRKNPG